MRTLCIAATCVLLAAPAAHAGSIIDSFIGGNGLSLGDCNTDHCSLSVGKQKHVVRRSDFGSAATNGMDIGDKVMGAAKSQLKARAKGFDTSVSERPAPSKQREQSVVDRSDEELQHRLGLRRDERQPVRQNPVILPEKRLLEV